jgi:hypothetical protein
MAATGVCVAVKAAAGVWVGVGVTVLGEGPAVAAITTKALNSGPVGAGIWQLGDDAQPTGAITLSPVIGSDTDPPL